MNIYMKIFSSEEIRFLENCAVETGTSYEKMMDKAGKSVVSFLKNQMTLANKSVVVLCGKGNNGGDGFVAARNLFRLGAEVTVVLVQGNPTTPTAKNAYDLMEKDIPILDWNFGKFEIENELEVADIVIDAVFGIGFRGDVNSDIGRLFNFVNNNCKAFKLAVDIPSGCECDSGKISNYCIKADCTISFTSIKPANVLSPSAKMFGKNVVAQVGIDKSHIDTMPANFSITKESDVVPMFSARNPYSHKGDYGTLLMICGSYGMIGAGIMAAKAALRTGVGLINMVVDISCYPLMSAAVPEAIFTIMDFSTKDLTKKSSEDLFTAITKSSACVIGPGLGESSEKYVPTVVKYAPCPIVLDADALNYIAKNISLLEMKKSPTVITPHPGEMARLAGKTIVQVEMDRLTLAKRFSKEYDVFTVLKGAGTITAGPDGYANVNTTGNAGMAKGGSGDILSGMIGSLLAQGFSPQNAVTAGVYIHGKAGDLCAKQFSQTSMLPTDLIDTLPQVFKAIESQLS